MADDAGALLVRSGLVSSDALDQARGTASKAGGTLGEHLVASGAIADEALTEFYRSRLLVPQVNPNTLAKLKASVIQAIPADMAVELRAVPVAFDSDGNLTVAMGDPSDRHAVDELTFFTGNYVVRAVATQMQIAWCLAHYYGHITELGRRLLQPRDKAVPEPTRAKGDTARVDAARHRVVAPVDNPPPTQTSRPRIDVLDRASPPPTPPPPTPPARPKPTPPPTPPLSTKPSDLDATIESLDIKPDRSGAVVAPHLAKPTDTKDADTKDADTKDADVTPTIPDDALPLTPSGRSRSASGEIVVQAAAPAAEIEPESSEPEISIEPGGEPIEEPTSPGMRMPRRARVPDPPELAERIGEVEVKAQRPRDVTDEQSVVIDQSALRPPPIETSGEIAKSRITISAVIVEEASPADSLPVIIHDTLEGTESEPILLDRKRTAPPVGVPESEIETADIVMLDRRPRTTSERRRLAKQTQVGLGSLGRAATGKPERPKHDTDIVPEAIAVGDATEVMTTPAFDDGEETDDVIEAPVAKKTAAVVDDDNDDDKDAAVERLEDDRDTGVHDIVAAPSDRPIDHDPVDDGWGPPGTTIPPPFLGAVPGADTDLGPTPTIPIADGDSAPLVVVPPRVMRPATGAEAGALSTAGLNKDLEVATMRLVELLSDLDKAGGRDEVIYGLINLLSETHNRAAFFAVKAGELSVFTIRAPKVAQPRASLSLELPSTFQDVVGTRLPYRGPVVDDPSRDFLSSLLGNPPTEMLIIPVAVRDRVVGALYADGRRRHTFDDHFAIAARAAGRALERILKTKRT